MPPVLLQGLIIPVAAIVRRRELRRALRRYLLIFISVFVIAGTIAPFVSASSFRGRIKRSLEGSLGRKVDFTAAHFTLFSGPGFLLDRVVISEDPRYGIEPFAYVPTLSVRLRLDKLLIGQIRPASLSLSEPSLNLVKREDGTWNVVELVNRLAASGRGGLSLIPALEVSGGRIDFKFGTRKSIVYLADTDLSVYARHSGKVSVDFSGSPARTDRAGNSFSHLHGSATWLSSLNRLDAEATLDESNLSEVTELLEGRDVGIHGMISSHAEIRGPLSALSINGELRLSDVRRWDLLPSTGERWRVKYHGDLDVFAHRLHVATIARQHTTTMPVSLDMRLKDFLTAPSWAIVANLHQAPLEQILPLATRLGMNLPQGLTAQGAVDGALGYSSSSGLAGSISIHNAVATLPDLPTVHAGTATTTIFNDHVHLEPAIIQESNEGTLLAGGDYYFSGDRARATVTANAFPVTILKRTLSAWLGAPDALAALSGGQTTGKLEYGRHRAELDATASVADWSGELSLTDATLKVPGLAVPLLNCRGDIGFDPTAFDLTHFSAEIQGQVIHGSYRYNTRAKRTEHLRIQLAEADLAAIESWLSPSLEDRGLFARLRFGKRTIPDWMASRNLEGEADVQSLTAGDITLGALTARFIWQGSTVQIVSARLARKEMTATLAGTLDLKGYSPRYRFRTQVNGFAWGGGLLNASGEWTISGTGLDAWRSLQASGTFSGEDVHLSPADQFDTVSGDFFVTPGADVPRLQIADLEATQNGDTWTGDGSITDDGKLSFDLDHDGQPAHFVSDLTPKSDSTSSGAVGTSTVTATSERSQ